MKFSLFYLNTFLFISLSSMIATAEIIDLKGKTPAEYSSMIQEQRQKTYSKLGKHCALKTQEEFEIHQSHVTDPDLRISEDEFLQYIKKIFLTSNGYDKIPVPSAESCFMTKQEYYALTLYTGEYYGSINKALRDRIVPEIEKYRVLIKFIQASLQKFRPYEGFVKRGVNLSGPDLDAQTPPKSVVFYAFTSTSVANAFSRSVNYLIQSHNCRYIAPFSKYQGEEEVLCQPGTTVEIIHRDPISNGITSILADEIPSDFNVDDYLESLK